MKECFKRSPILFEDNDYKLIFVFIFPICDILNTNIKAKYLVKYYEFFLILSTYLSYIFSFIFLIILKLRTSKQEIRIKIDSNNGSMNSVNELREKKEGIENFEVHGEILSFVVKKEARKKSIKSLIIIIILIGANMSYSHFVYESYYDRRTIGLSYKILIFFLLSFLILKYKYAKHHYLTIIINTIALLLKYSTTIIASDSEIWVPNHLWFYFLYGFSFCLLFTLGKYYMDTYYITPYFILFIIGIVLTIILLFIALIKYLFGFESQIFCGFRDNVNTVENIFLFLADILTQFGMNLGLWITVYYFTPLHTIIAENIMEIGYYIIDFNKNEILWKDNNVNLNRYLYPFIHIINLICSLVFNEIIILNFCGLDYYTKKRIRERETEDKENIDKMISSGGNDRLSSESGSFAN